MLKRLQFLRGNAQALSTYTGLPGELLINTDTHSIVVSDGVTPGGHSTASANAMAEISANITTLQSDIITANTDMKGYVDAQFGSIPIGVSAVDFVSNINILSANVGNLTIDVAANSLAITTANTNMKGYVDSQVSTLTANAGVQAGQIADINFNSAIANLNMTNYVNSQITTANTSMKGYVDTQIGSIPVGVSVVDFVANIGALTANAGVQAGQISTFGTDLTTANTNMKGYVDSQVSTLTANAGAQADSITSLTANASVQHDSIVTLGTDLTTANTNMKGYVDSQVSTLTVNAGVQSTAIDSLIANAGVQAGQIASAEANITLANTNLKGYVDAAVTSLTANAGTQSTAIDSLIANAGVQAGQISTLGTDITTANTNMKGYVDAISSTKANLSGATFTGNITVPYIVGNTIFDGNLSITGNLDVAGTQTTYDSNNVVFADSLIYLADNNTGDVLDIGFISSFTNPGYQHTGLVRDAGDGIWKLFANVSAEPVTTVDFTDAIYSTLKVGKIISDSFVYANNESILVSINSTIDTANTNMKGYVDSQVSSLTANAGAQSDSITSLTANAGAQHDSIVTLGTDITTANTNMKGYVDAAVTSLTANAGAQSDSIVSLFANAGTQHDSIINLGTDITTANTNMKGYVDSQISTIPTYSNVNVAAYLPGYTGSFGGTAASVVNGVYTTDIGTVTNTMLANSAITINGTPVSLGGSTTIAGGGGSIAILDEGVSLTTSATSIDFVGAGVTATNSSGNVTVTIPSTSTIGRHAMYIAAGAISPSTVGGCAALIKIAGATNQPDIVSLDFDPTTQEYAQFSIVMPKKWDEGTVTFKAHWSHAATTTNFGVVWDLQAVAISDLDPFAVAFGTAQLVTDTGGTTDTLYTSPESSAITIAGTPLAEDMVFFRISRVTGNASDTMAVDARLHGITLYISTAAETDV